ncbi:hypothetical protein Zmor_003431 [Zophobas morio]|uniref:Uncharacterized protein n=1 Tax=Zophobas morio TaxID=2755281 RepID=A0AA38M1A3_9CUCU|nr:hypothetical protein Zmor_003431 [Zophobas morio]
MIKLSTILILIANAYVIENITLQNHGTVVLTPPSENVHYYPNKKEESARTFLKLYNSINPVVILIDDTQQSLNDAADFVKNLYTINPKVEELNFILIKFNVSGASPVLATSKNNRRRFDEILNEKVSPGPLSFLGYENATTSAVFFGILNAANLLPPNSGLVVFVKGEIEDEELTPHARALVARKRIQVFVIWGGKHDEVLLKELAQFSRGAFLRAPGKGLSELYYEHFLENIGTLTSSSLLLSRKNLRGTHNLDFLIDSDVTGIHISITPDIPDATLTTPRGYNIDVLNADRVSQFSVGSFIRENEIHLNTTATQDVGVWRLRLGNARTLYNITIFAHTKLTTNAIVTVQNLTGSNKKNQTRPKIVKLGIVGDVSSISNVSFIGEDGTPILRDVKFAPDKNWENYLTENIDGTGSNVTKELNISIKNVPKGPFYAVVNGKDAQGNDFQRLSYVRNDIRKEFYLPPITVDVGLGSELITQALRQPQLFFEVTNNGERPTLVRFFARDEKSLLVSMVPLYRWINPGETATVRLTLTTRPGAYQDVVTFTAAGSETVSKRVIVDVGVFKEDRRDPELDYHFTSDCSDVLFGSCEDGTWTVEVKAKDTGSGLLQVISIPKGLYFPHGFTTGTTEEVTGYFSESCCNPDLKLVAFDRQNNRRTRHLNAYRAGLGPGAIAAICLGVIVLFLILLGLGFLIKRCCKKLKKKGSYDLPIYRGPRRL